MRINVDKMILKAVNVLPYGLVNSRQKFGTGGETFMEFVKWVATRTRAHGFADNMERLGHRAQLDEITERRFSELSCHEAMQELEAAAWHMAD